MVLEMMNTLCPCSGPPQTFGVGCLVGNDFKASNKYRDGGRPH